MCVPSHGAYRRNIPPEQVRFTDPRVVLPPRHPLHATLAPPHWRLPLRPAREGAVLVQPSDWLPTTWLLVTHRHSQPQVDQVDQVGQVGKESQVEVRVKDKVGAEVKKGEAKTNLAKLLVKYDEAEDMENMERDAYIGEREVEKKRGLPKAGGKKERGGSWPSGVGEWPGEEEEMRSEGKKRSWSRAGGRKEGRRSWPFEGGDLPKKSDFPEKEEERVDNFVAGGGEGVHWSRRAVPDLPSSLPEEEGRRRGQRQRRPLGLAHIKRIVEDPLKKY